MQSCSKSNSAFIRGINEKESKCNIKKSRISDAGNDIGGNSHAASA